MDTEMTDDLLIGIKSIAGWLNQPPRKVGYMAEQGHLPLFKIGSNWAGRKSTIRSHIINLESARAA